MIPALLLGREGSIGFPGKNLYPVLGRPLMEYPLMAALNATLVDRVYVSTDSEKPFMTTDPVIMIKDLHHVTCKSDIYLLLNVLVRNRVHIPGSDLGNFDLVYPGFK